MTTISYQAGRIPRWPRRLMLVEQLPVPPARLDSAVPDIVAQNRLF